MALVAGGINIDPSLQSALSGIGNNQYNQIASNYGKARTGLANDANARGMNGNAAVGNGSYANQRLNATQGLDVGNLESALGGGVGNTAYQNSLHQRDYEQNSELAKRIGSLNSPSLLDQIFQGIGSIGKPAAGIYGAWGSNAGGGGGVGPLAAPSVLGNLDDESEMM